jgi:hypothetical protein
MVLVQVVFAIIALTIMFLGIAVTNVKTTINKWIKEFLQTGHIQGNEVSELKTLYSFDGLTNMTFHFDSMDKFKVLRNTKIRNKIREYKKLRTARNYSILAMIIFIGLMISILVLSE